MPFADGVTDDWAEIQAELDALPIYTKPWGETGESRTATQYTYRLPPGHIFLSQELVIPDNINVDITGSDTVLETADGVDYAIFQDAPNGRFHKVRIRNLTFWKCGIRVGDQSRNKHIYEDLLFKDTPDWGIKIMAAGDVDFASGGVVGGEITRCEFEQCGGAVTGARPHGGGGIFVQGDQSDNWTVRGCAFNRNFGIDIKLHSSGWRIFDNYFEGRSVVDLGTPQFIDRPHIHIDGTATASIYIENGNRFGNEINTPRNSQPPREMVVVGPLAGSATGHLSDVHFKGNICRGCANPGATIDRANAVVRLGIGVRKFVWEDNYVFQYNTALIESDHGNAHEGIKNEIDIPTDYEITPEGPQLVFSVKPSSDAWIRTDKPQSEDNFQSRVTEQLLRNTEDIHTDLGNGNFWGVTGSVTLTKTDTGPDGLANSAYRFDKTATGTAEIFSTLNPQQPADGPITATVWLRKVSGGLDNVRLFFSGSSDTSELLALPDDWKPFTISGFADGAAMSLFIGGEAVGSSATGAFLFAMPQVEPGHAATAYLERVDSTRRIRPGGSLQCGTVVIFFHTTLPTTHTTEVVGDLAIVPSSGMHRCTSIAPLTWSAAFS